MKATNRKTDSLLHLRGITKRFPGVQALDGVDLEVRSGEVLGLVGENGSGKSTLLKIAAGHQNADAGEIVLDGRPVSLAGPADALNRGIALIAQEISVQPQLTVAENLLDGRLPRRAGLIDWRRMHRQTEAELRELDLDLSPHTMVGALPLHQQQMLSIARVVRRRPRLVLFDEPTSSLTADEVKHVYAMIHSLRAAGSAVVYITHRLREYFDLADRVVVLRDGRTVATREIVGVDEQELVRLMVGREQVQIFQRPAQKDHGDFESAALRLEARGITSARLADIDLDVRAGEIVGVAGQAGSGRTSLAETLFGRWPYSGSVRVAGREVRLSTPRAAIDAGIALVPEDRKGAGLVLSMSVHENLAMASWRRTSALGVRRPGHERAGTTRVVRDLSIRTAGLDVPAVTLSGGNQQKVAIGKWLLHEPSVLILDEPTRGVDVGAKAEIYALVEELASAGLGVLVISSELLEVMRLAHRVLVMSNGRVVGEEAGARATEESITRLAFRAEGAPEPGSLEVRNT
ncbi:sugar ABC transporter ATP-binding protein [Streptomyces malaysiensis]|uniref:sugar ABC transporter ATP-binding protein n=1 Tax=Streptomyces malaysiensis TaxID=92644 RepID=UPI002B28293C|nr:sugar ABC transporter ATP-binding protein [Streptomyces malaysiensis]